MRLFKDNNVTAKGKVLPYEEFKLFYDLETREIPPEKQAMLIEKAESLVDAEIPFLPLTLYREFFVTGNRSHYEDAYFRRREIAFYLAMAEAVERRGRFTDKLCDVLWAIMEETTWAIPAHLCCSPANPRATVPDSWNPRFLHAVDLFAAATAGMLAIVYLYTKDILDTVSPFIAERLEYEILERSVKPYLNYAFHWSGENGSRVNNWNPWCNCSILLATAIMEKDPVNREAVVERSIGQLDNFCRFYPEDGGCDEGPSYWNVAGAKLFESLEIIYDMTGGKIDLFDQPLVRAIGEFEPRFNINGDRFINFADCPARITGNGYMIARYGKRCGSEMMERFGLMIAKRLGAGSLNTSSPYDSIRNLYAPVVKEADTTKADRFTYFPGNKVAVCRQSENTAEGLFYAMKGGTNGESHNHNDVGSFVVYYQGKPVIIDAGVGPYTRDTFGPNRYKAWFMQSGYHSLPSFGGVDQKAGADYRSTDERADRDRLALSMELNHAYPEEAGIVSYRRECALDESGFTVSEDITLTEEREIVFHMLTPREPVVTAPGTIALAEGRTLSYDPTALTAEIEAFVSEGLNTVTAWDTEKMYRIHLKCSAKTFSGKITIK